MERGIGWAGTAVFGVFFFGSCLHILNFCYKFAVKLFYKCFTTAMATFKILILPHQRREDGSYNVKIRVIHNRKTRYIKTPHYVSGADVSRRKKNGREELKIRNQAVIDALDGVILDYRRRLVSAGMDVDGWDVDRLVGFLATDPKVFRLDFIAFMKRFADGVERKGQEGTAKRYRVVINSLRRFLGRGSVDVSEITTGFIRSYEAFLRDEPKCVLKEGYVRAPSDDRGKKKSVSVIASYLSALKAAYNAAKLEYNDEDNGVINIPWSPFSRFVIPQKPLAAHRVLTIEQVQKIIDYPYSGQDTLVDMAKDMFILSFALMGINTADLYELREVKGDILRYNRKKTRRGRLDNAAMEVRIEPEIRGLLAKYYGDDRVTDVGRRYKNSMSFNVAVNDGMHQLGAAIGVLGLTHYYARHTMASLCANKLGVDIARVDEMLNHSDSRLRLARVYIAKDFRPLWEANRRLLDLFDWGFFGVR